MYSICFTIAGVIFSILLFVLYNFKSNLKLLENKIYYGIIVTTIISGLIEIYSFILVRTSIFVNSVLYLFSLKYEQIISTVSFINVGVSQNIYNIYSNSNYKLKK